MAKSVIPAILLALVCGWGCARAAELTLVEKGVSVAPIMLAEDASAETRQAAADLALYLGKISGAKPQIVEGTQAPAPARAIWVGLHPQLAAAVPQVKLTFEHPEEILIACNGQHLVVAGRDRTLGGKQTEFGTANAVYTFLEKHLDVRWLWPGALGEDLIHRDTITLAPFEYRFHPIFRHRHLWPRQPREWHTFQRVNFTSLQVSAGHAYTKWWDAYHEQHPDWFALRSDGTRTPERWGPAVKPEAVKLCVSNPEVAAQWLENAQEALQQDPARIMVSASPNDGAGFCVCEKCRAMDDPHGPAMWGYVALTDRYVKYWNSLARRLRERFPQREVWVGAYAYSAYKTPPSSVSLEPNIAVGYVGHFPLANDEATQKEKEGWLGWAAKASTMFYRPNLFHYSGGWLSLPSIATRRTSEDFRFLADHKCIGIEVDTLPRNWSTQGVQYYLLAQLAYDPYQDAGALLQDYYRRGFGPAAGEIERYFNLMEQAHEEVLKRIIHSSGKGREMVDACREIYTAAVLNPAEDAIRRAEAQAAGSDLYRQRVAFIRTGFDFVKLQIEIINTMKTVRESKGEAVEAVRRAVKLCEARAEMLTNSPPYALSDAQWYFKSRRLADWIGPPSEELRKSAYAGPEAVPDMQGQD